MRAFIAYALERNHLPELAERLESITAGAADAGYSAYAHVRDGQRWVLGAECIPDMMAQVFREIEASDVVLLDLTSHSSSKRTGINIELGYALACQKPVAALFRSGDRPNMTTDLAYVEASYDVVGQIRLRTAVLLRTLEDKLAQLRQK